MGIDNIKGVERSNLIGVDPVLTLVSLIVYIQGVREMVETFRQPIDINRVIVTHISTVS